MPNTQPYSILVIDNEQEFFDVLFHFSTQLKRTPATSFAEAYQYLQAGHSFDAILLDLALTDDRSYHEGLDELPKLMERINGPVIIVTYDNSWDTYQAALDIGAAGFLTKENYKFPVWKNYIEKTIRLFNDEDRVDHNLEIIDSELYNEVIRKFSSLQHYAIPIVLEGETGVGKGFIIKNIWTDNFDQGGHPITINLKKNWDEDLRELWYNYAHEGIIIWAGLDAIDFKQQEELLELISGKVYESCHQWFFTSNKPLDQLHKNGQLLPQLFEYLDYFTISIPRLSDRIEGEIIEWLNLSLIQTKICPIGSHFFSKKAEGVFEKEVIEKLAAYHWPGNIRELQEIIRLAIANAERMEKRKIDLDCLQDRVKRSESNQEEKPAPQWTPEQQKVYDELVNIEKALNESGYNKEEVKKQLGLEWRELRYRVKKAHLEFPFILSSRLCKMFDFEYGYEKAINILIGLAPENKKMLEGLRKNLVLTISKYPVIVKDNVNSTLPGDILDKKFTSMLDEAQIILLLMCPDFFSSEKLVKIDLLDKALEKIEKATVIPIDTIPSIWRSHPQLVRLQHLPPGSIPISEWKDPNTAFVEIVKGIEKVLNTFKTK